VPIDLPLAICDSVNLRGGFGDFLQSCGAGSDHVARVLDATYGDAETGKEESLGGATPFANATHFISSSSFRASPNSA
jgi:hypothetical protein